MSIFIPLKINYFILKNLNSRLVSSLNYVYIYNNLYFMGIICKKLIINKNSLILSTYSDPKIYKNNRNNFITRWYYINNIKIKFSGKGYKLVKQNLCLNLLFNTSHNQWLLLFKTLSIKLHKQKYLLLSKNIIELLKIVILFVDVRLVNIYTKRGLRCGKQKIIRKVGKRSN